MLGLYPNAGQDYYLINTPLLKETTFVLQNGKTFTIKANKLSDKNRYIRSIKLNGKDYPYSAIRHKDIMAGGKLVLEMGNKPSNWGKELGL
jgi:putative alpha-1,2-mannosidase